MPDLFIFVLRQNTNGPFCGFPNYSIALPILNILSSDT